MQSGDHTSFDYAMQETYRRSTGRETDSPGGCNQYAPDLPVAHIDNSRATFRTIRKKSSRTSKWLATGKLSSSQRNLARDTISCWIAILERFDFSSMQSFAGKFRISSKECKIVNG